MNSPSLCLCLLAAFFSITQSHAQVNLVKDINTTPFRINNRLDMSIQINGILYFCRYTETGNELWKSDGTTAGTVLVKDIQKGHASSNPDRLTNINGILYFSAEDSHGRELWKTNGTEAGTVMVKDIYPGTRSGDPKDIFGANGIVYFTAYDGIYNEISGGQALWKSDGTAQGTVKLKPMSFRNESAVFKTIGNTIYFSAYGNGAGPALWKSDGTASGTVFVKDIFINGTAESLEPQSMTEVNGQLLFVGLSWDEGAELWTSDGTETGTVLLKNIAAGSAPGVNSSLVNINGSVFFSGNGAGYNPVEKELWKTDGTSSGTVLVKNINPSYSSSPDKLTDVNGVLYFTANDGINGIELWKSDGTAAGTVMVKNIHTSGSSSPDKLINVNGVLYFTANDGVNGTELWKSDGTDAGTVMVRDNASGSASSKLNKLTNVNGILYFTANTSLKSELWRSDGTPAGTVMIKDTPGFQIYLCPSGTTLFFAFNEDSGDEIWKTDGTIPGTVLVEKISSMGTRSCFPDHITAFKDHAYFIATDEVHGGELWKSDGTESGTTMVKDILSGKGSGVWNNSWTSLVAMNDKLFFSGRESVHGNELWKSDGTQEGTIMVADIFPGSESSYPRNFTVIGSVLYFTAKTSEHGEELWRYDASGAAMVKDLWPGTLSGIDILPDFKVINNIMYFEASDNNGKELWRSDGTTIGTYPLADIAPGSLSSSPSIPESFKGEIYFFADNGMDGNGFELYKSNGTGPGTVKVKDGLIGYFLTNMSDKVLLFMGYDAEHGYELWKTDGTEAGTTLLTDIAPGPQGSDPYILATAHGVLYFSAYHQSTGYELWKTDGTTDGTTLIKDLNPGPASSKLSSPLISESDGLLYFQATGPSGQNGIWSSDGTPEGTKFITGGVEITTRMIEANNYLFFGGLSFPTGIELWKFGPLVPVSTESTLMNDPIKVFPNPAKDQLNVLLPEEKGEKNIVIHTPEGRSIEKISTNENHLTVNVTSYNKGLFIISVKTARGNYFKRFVVN